MSEFYLTGLMDGLGEFISCSIQQTFFSQPDISDSLCSDSSLVSLLSMKTTEFAIRYSTHKSESVERPLVSHPFKSPVLTSAAEVQIE